MNDTLKQLYNRFYTPLPMAEVEQEIEDCHRQLIERLEKPERKNVMREEISKGNAGNICCQSVNLSTIPSMGCRI